MKRCKKCGETKPLDDFYREKGGRDALGNLDEDVDRLADAIAYLGATIDDADADGVLARARASALVGR